MKPIHAARTSYAGRRSVRSAWCILSAFSFASLLGLFSAGSILSIGSSGSILSVGKRGAVLTRVRRRK